MEAKLQALKVVDLKKLLQDNLLPASGTKAELVKRLLENPAATSSLSGEDAEEDLIGDIAEDTPSTAAPAAQSAAVAAPATTEPVDSAPPQATTTSDANVEPVEPAPTSQGQEARKAEVIAELQKRKARAQKFGTSTEEIDEKLSRIERFGLEEEAGVSLRVLDGELKPQKNRKDAKTEKKSGAAAAANGGPSGAQKPAVQAQVAAEKAAPAPAPVDPVEEEKKRKRLERFGGAATASSGSTEPADKKAKPEASCRANRAAC